MRVSGINLRRGGDIYTGILYDGSKQSGSVIVYLTQMGVVPEYIGGELSGRMLVVGKEMVLEAGYYVVYNESGIDGVISRSGIGGYYEETSEVIITV